MGRERPVDDDFQKAVMKISLDHPERDVRRSPAVRCLLLEIERRLRQTPEPTPEPTPESADEPVGGSAGYEPSREESRAGPEHASVARSVQAYRESLIRTEDDQGRPRTRSSAVSG